MASGGLVNEYNEKMFSNNNNNYSSINSPNNNNDNSFKNNTCEPTRLASGGNLLDLHPIPGKKSRVKCDKFLSKHLDLFSSRVAGP